MGKKIKETKKVNKIAEIAPVMDNESDGDNEIYDLFTTDRTDQFENELIKSRRLFLNAKVNLNNFSFILTF